MARREVETPINQRIHDLRCFSVCGKTNSWKSVQRYFVLVRVLALVTNVSLEENVWIIENKVFNHNGNWLNNILTYLSCWTLLLKMSFSNFMASWFYEQIDEVARVTIRPSDGKHTYLFSSRGSSRTPWLWYVTFRPAATASLPTLDKAYQTSIWFTMNQGRASSWNLPSCTLSESRRQ